MKHYTERKWRNASYPKLGDKAAFRRRFVALKCLLFREGNKTRVTVSPASKQGPQGKAKQAGPEGRGGGQDASQTRSW